MKLLFTFLGLFLSCCMYLTAADTAIYTAEFEALTRGKSYNEKCTILRDSVESMVENTSKILVAASMYHQLILEDKNNPNTGWAMQKLGRAYWQIGGFDSAYIYYSKASTFFVHQNVPLDVFDNYIYLGLLFVATKDYPKAEYYYQKASQYLPSIQPLRIQKHRTAVRNWNLAHINTRMQRYDKASGYLSAAFTILREIDTLPGHYINTSHCLTNYYMGYLQACLHHYDSAVYYYRTSIHYSSLHSNNYIRTNALAQIGVPFNALHQYDSTIHYCTESLSLAELHGNNEYKPLALEQLAEAFSATHQYQKAFECYKRFKITNDSINNYDRVIAGLLNQKAENEKLEIEARKNEAELRGNYTAVIASLIVLSLLIIAFIFYNRNKLTKKLNNQLAESNTTKNKLFAVVSHDLKGPLSAFSELSNILSHHRSAISEDERAKIMDTMHTSSINILGLLDNLLSWSRSQMKGYKIYPEVMNLQELVGEVITSIADLACAKKVEILCEISDEIEITADRNALETVMRNLISNAIKFSYSGGNIVIQARQVDGQTEISVSDSGVGLSDAIKDSLFELSPTKSTMGTNHEKGTGLGLLICKDIITLHGGKIWAEANGGAGTTFTILL